MKHPIAIPALLYAAGIVAGSQLDPGLFVLFGGALLCLALAAMTRSWIAIAALLALCGWAHLSVRMTPMREDDLRVVLSAEPAIVRIRGALAETPATRLVQKGEVLQARSHCVVEVSEIKAKEWRRGSGRVVVLVPEELPEEWLRGTVVEAEGVIQPPKPALAPGLFDYQRHLRWKGIHFILNTEKATHIQFISDSTAGFPARAKRAFIQWTKSTLSQGLTGEEETVRLLWAMTLGWTTALTDEVSEPLIKTGTLHVFAISGMHIGLITLLIVQALRVMRVPRGWNAVIAGVTVWFYTFATGGQASAVRSAIMSTVILASWGLRRPGNLINSLSAAALIILLWDPRQLFHPGFQLSFTVVYALALFAPPLKRWHDKFIHPDPLLAEQVRTRFHRFAWRCEGIFATAVIASIAAWIGSAPTTAYYFNVISPVALLSNLLVVPLSDGALACCLLSLLCSPIFSWLTEVFNHAAYAMMTAMLFFANGTANWSWSALNARSPTPAEFLLIYGVIAGAASWLASRLKWAIAWAGAASLGACLVVAERFSAQDALTVISLPGDGTGIYVAQGGKNALIDCGSAFSAERVVKPFLRARGVDRLDVLALTHGDAQHVGGVPIVLQNFKPRNVVVSDAKFRSPVYRAVVDDLRLHAPQTTTSANAGDALPWGGVVHPAEGANWPRADDAAMALRLNKHGRTILLLGDLGRNGQEELLNREQDISCDVMIISRSSEASLLLPGVIERAKPKVVIFNGSAFGVQRMEDALEAQVVRSGAKFFNTEFSGAVTVILNKNRLMQVTPMIGDEIILR